MTFVEPARELSVLAEAEVVVAGGGPGGITAAVAAARSGKSTILIERYGVLGGMTTTCLMGPFFGYMSPVNTKGNETANLLLGGIPVELIRRSQAYGGSYPDDKLDWDGVAVDPEIFKFVCDDICRESGVKVILHTWVVGTIVEDGRIKAVIVESKSGRQVIAGDVFVDATGDADIAYFSGAGYTKGRKADGAMEAMGTRFRVGGVAQRNAEEILKEQQIVTRGILEGKIRPYCNEWTDERGASVRDDVVAPDVTRIAGDGTDVMQLTQAEMKLRKDAWDMYAFMKENVEAYKNSYFMDTPFTVGVRETRQIIGEYRLGDRDVMDAVKHEEDSIARGCWWIDIHCPLGRIAPWDGHSAICAATCRTEEFTGESCIMKNGCRNQLPPAPFLKPDEWYGIPYGCLIPDKVDNLLVSGRCISATHIAMSSTRVVGTCLAIGQAAGTAAAMAAEERISPRRLDVKKLQQRLKEARCKY